MSGQCKDCRFWEQDQLYPHLGHCNKAGDWAEWTPDKQDLETPAFGARDAEAYHAAVMTTPDFGCVLFKED